MTRALLKQALDALENHAGNYKLTVKEGVVHNAAIAALQAALAQPEPEPEPVAWATRRARPDDTEGGEV